MVSVGVSGHRSLVDIEAITDAVDEALRMILTCFGAKTLQVISPLAEGADRVVVWRAKANYSVRLVVPLPLEISDYMLDFKSISSKAEFTTLLEQADQVVELPAGDTREACYLASGMYVLDHSDVIIAVWDGVPARKMGGTAEIVAEGRRREMPMAWVQVARRERESLSSKRKVAGGVRVHYERFPTQPVSEAGRL
ncbi:MAG: hypothetical protein A2Z16_15295 [Chloroflexi bacterium RBG_16_54_18]|nr:MAG: hypothetical protein A2Z16_15295 [Chloroflexi bacterium RBG_16_54_18]